MKPLDFDLLREWALSPERRFGVEQVLAKLQEGLDASQRGLAQARDAVHHFSADVAKLEPQVADWQSKVDRVESILRDTIGERNL